MVDPAHFAVKLENLDRENQTETSSNSSVILVVFSALELSVVN